MLFQYYGTGSFQGVGSALQRLGLFDVILPFMLVFAIMLAALRQVEVFKDKKTQTIVSLVIALTFIGPHLTGFYNSYFGFDPVIIMNQAIPAVGLLAIAITLGLIMAGLLGFEKFEGGMQTFAIWVSVLAVLLIFGYSLGWVGRIPFFGLLAGLFYDPGLQMAVLAILVFGGLIAFMTGEDKKKD